MSELRLYSLGIVVEDKPADSDIILVSPIEVLNIQPDGSIKDTSMKFEGTLKDSSDRSFSTEMKATNYLRAKWLPFGHSNRGTAPDVVKNETVLLFKFGNVDEYYWTTIFHEKDLRRLETVRYVFSNVRSGIKAFDENSSYWVEVDTKNKRVRLHTSKNDGEFTAYDILIDTRNGVFTFKDDRNNTFYLVTATDHFVIDMKKKITMMAQDGIDMRSLSITIVGDESVTIRSREINLEGNVNIKGNVKATGSIIDMGGNTANHSHFN